MSENSIKLADMKSSEKLIYDLYIDLRNRVNAWASVTHQTAQARMGYVGQHLTSVVTGFPGGKSGARGHDLLLPDGEFAEIKTCYRIDQLGQCNSCGARIAGIEQKCSGCGSTDIRRNNDSKWLIGIRNNEEFAHVLEPKAYYLVLFEFVDITSPDTIRSSIWEVDPKLPGFAYCMVDYRTNIQPKSSSRAPFNLWPYSLKFCLMRPLLIYRSTISLKEDSVRTEIFPGMNQAQFHSLEPIAEHSRSRNLTLDKIKLFAGLLGISVPPLNKKQDFLGFIQNYIADQEIAPAVVADKLATALYFQDIKPHLRNLPEPLGNRVLNLAAGV